MSAKPSLHEQVQQEIYMGTVPMVKKERIYGFRDITLVSAGFGVASWCYPQGAWLASVLPFHLAVFAAVIPMLLAGLIMVLVCILPTRYGIDIWVYQKAVFGQRLVFVIFAVAILTTWGWYAVNSQVLGGSFNALFGYAGVQLGESWNAAFALVCPVIGFVIATKGPTVVKYAVYITVPCVIFVGILLFVKTASATNLSSLMQIVPPIGETYASTRIAFMIMVDATFAFAFSWYPVLGSLSRLTKSENASYWGQVIGIILSTCFFVTVGVLTATLMTGKGLSSPYPSDWLVNFGGAWCVIAQIALILGNIITQTLGVYSLSLATKIFKSSWNFKAIAAVYSVYCAVLIVWQGIWDYYFIFLAAVAIVAGPAIALITADFYVVRRRAFSFRSVFRRDGCDAYRYTGGFNLVTLGCFLAGIACYLLVYDPIHYVIRNEALVVLTPSGISYLVSFLGYCLLSRIPAVRRYLLQEKAGERADRGA
ncbi:MAG: cytosine permease [Clostridiales Family XIII bacterium]|jgi:NCS1 family nucleobase:cation symporter-1|nr:cytosine permease [Clostridiales Family XIII bacterium]